MTKKDSATKTKKQKPSMQLDGKDVFTPYKPSIKKSNKK